MNCNGCGYELQVEKKLELGYINKIDDTRPENYCKRCYEMIFRNKRPETFLEDKDYWNLFEKITNNNTLYILVLDLYNLEGSIIPKMINKLINKDVIIVLNKKDILPKLVSEKKYIRSVEVHPEIKKLKNIKKIISVSSLKKYNVDELLKEITKYKIKDTYMIGCANVGKSSLINALINSILGDNKKHIATSYYSGTTLGLINIPLDKKYDLIDTPGIINTEDINNALDKETLEIIFPKTEIRPLTYQLEEQQTIFISGFWQLNFLKGYNQGVTIYTSNYMPIHRTKLENAEYFRDAHLGCDIIVPPTYEEVQKIQFKRETIEINQGNWDIVISGLGWVNIKNKYGTLKYEVIVPENVKVVIREGLI